MSKIVKIPTTTVLKGILNFLPAAKPTGLVEADSSSFFFHLLTKFKKLSCLWADLADTLVDGRGRSWLPCHQMAHKSATRGHQNQIFLFVVRNFQEAETLSLGSS